VTEARVRIGRADALVRALGLRALAAATCACSGCGGSSSGGAAPQDASVHAPPDVTDVTDVVDVADIPSDAACTRGPERDGPYTRVSVIGETAAMGIIDPSVEYAAGATGGLMTYTAAPDPAHVHIAIAASVDAGASWHRQADVTVAAPITISTSDGKPCGAAACTGTFVHESSSLVLDGTDPDASRRLKVFAHGYFYDSARHLDLGYIGLYTAAAPDGPWTETKLFGWPSSSPVSTSGVAYDVHSDPRIPEMHDCFIVGEPGALGRPDGTIDLALGCVVATGGSWIDVRLLRSKDHGLTWSFVATLLSRSDADALGAVQHQINGPDLFRANGAVHLVVSPDGPVNGPSATTFDGYRGCIVVEVADLDAGVVARCGGAPIVEAAYLGAPGQFVGACSADEGASAAGMLIPVPDFSASPDVFRIWASGIAAP
jgi:hypothetical protein